jgi:Bacterial Ig-like domain (group 2)
VTEPSASSSGQRGSAPPGTDVLVIQPSLSGIALGASATLTAVVTTGGASGRPIVASWTSDAPDIARIQANGRLDALQFGEATIRATYETLAATLPLRVVPDYTGNWSGRYRVTDCTRISGSAPSPCRFVVGCCYGLKISLTQNGATPSGSLDLLDASHTLLYETGPVTGRIDATNSLVLTGMTRSSGPGQPSQTTLSEWSTTLTANEQMAGGFILMQSFRNDFGDQQLKLTCDLVDVLRSKP